jgi:Ca2+-transporting ATPase
MSDAAIRAEGTPMPASAQRPKPREPLKVHGVSFPPQSSVSPWHALPAGQVASSFEVDPLRGLTAAEVEERARRSGRNALPEPPKRSSLRVLLAQFANPLIYLLLGAAVLSAMLREWSDAVVITVVVLINAVIGAIQEGRAERAIDALRRAAGRRARVLRDGAEAIVDAETRWRPTRG